VALYLLHASSPLMKGNGPGAQHYLGYSHDERVLVRVWEHLAGRSYVGLIQAFHNQGIELTCAAIWLGATLEDEKFVKSTRHINRFCPICHEVPESPRGWEFLPCPVLIGVSSSTQWRKRKNRNIGVWRSISQTASTGWYRRGAFLGQLTSSRATLTRPEMTPGGSTSPATVLPGKSTTASSVSTKQPWPSTSECSASADPSSETCPESTTMGNQLPSSSTMPSKGVEGEQTEQ
jgi:hypothetical protein